MALSSWLISSPIARKMPGIASAYSQFGAGVGIDKDELRKRLRAKPTERRPWWKTAFAVAAAVGTIAGGVAGFSTNILSIRGDLSRVLEIDAATGLFVRYQGIDDDSVTLVAYNDGPKSEPLDSRGTLSFYKNKSGPSVSIPMFLKNNAVMPVSPNATVLAVFKLKYDGMLATGSGLAELAGDTDRYIRSSTTITHEKFDWECQISTKKFTAKGDVQMTTPIECSEDVVFVVWHFFTTLTIRSDTK